MSRKITPKLSGPLGINISLVGHLGVGKSAIVVKFLTKRYIVDYYAELEDRYSKLVNFRGENQVLNVFDTFDRDDRDFKQLLKWSHIILVVYSITSRSSFYRAREILETLTSQLRSKPHSDAGLFGGSALPCRQKIIFSVVANKSDLEKSRLVSGSEGESLAAEFQCIFQECTVTEDYVTVENIFRIPVEHYLDRKMRVSSMTNHSLGSTNNIAGPSQNQQECNNYSLGNTGSVSAGYRWIRSSSSKALFYDGNPQQPHQQSVPPSSSGENLAAGSSSYSTLLRSSRGNTPVAATDYPATPNIGNKKYSSGFRFFKAKPTNNK